MCGKAYDPRLIVAGLVLKLAVMREIQRLISIITK